MKRAAAVLLVSLASAVPGSAGGDDERPEEIVLRYRSPDLPDEAALRAFLTTPPPLDRVGVPTRVVIPRGAHVFSAPLDIRRDDVELGGETGRPGDAAIIGTGGPAIRVRDSYRTTVRGLSIRAPSGEFAVRLEGAASQLVEGFVSDVLFAGCDFDAGGAVAATTRVRGVTLTGCDVLVRADGGSGVEWTDGPYLFVSRTRLRTAPGASGRAGVFVRGAGGSESQGARARSVIVKSCRIEGDFLAGVEIADAADVLLEAVRVGLDGPVREDGAPRTGIVVRREALSSGVDQVTVVRSSVRRAHTGIALQRFGADANIRACSVRGCGSASPDALWGDTGGGVRVVLDSASCAEFVMQRSDLRALASPREDPAVRVLPAESAGNCFRTDVDDRNRFDPGRPRFEGDVR